MKRKSFYEKYIKRLQDFILSFIGIFLLSPLFLYMHLVVRKNLGNPTIFKQKRIGINHKPFEMYKFRSMTDEIDKKTGVLLPDENRLTEFGKKIRSTSLDELPQLINILKGEMSFVGPRPQMEDFLPLYSEKQLRRHEVRPGLSGLAQISGRNDIPWTKRFEYDVYYVDNISFLLDWKIMLLTLYKVITREGVEGEYNVTMEKFDGTN